MILSCNSCGKKFVVPDQAITADGRLVQCGSCGNKWKQFPIKSGVKQSNLVSKTEKIISKNPRVQKKIKNVKKSNIRKRREIDLYSPEYLAKKHGIKLDGGDKKVSVKNKLTDGKVPFGFYNSLLLFLIIIIILSRGLYFFEDFVVQKLPFTEFYIDYFFESIRNIFEIWKNLISSY